ncbi:MAG: nitrate reductase [Gemmatimonadota bacterium]
MPPVVVRFRVDGSSPAPASSASFPEIISTIRMNLTRRELLRFFGSAAALSAAGCDIPWWTRDEVIEVDSWHKSVCRFCGSGCETMVGLNQGRVVKVEGLQEGWNRGRLCIKGLMNRDILYVADRAVEPMIRSGGRLVPATWDDALDAAAEGFRSAIEAGGSDAVAFYGSGQLFTQESYTANKLFKAGIGTNNVDGNPRLCMASAAFGYKSVFGADEPSGCYADIGEATLFFVIGANMAECHPVVWEQVMDRKRVRPETRIIAVDPRRTPTTRQADMHLQIRPGTDVSLLNAMCHELIHSGLVDRDFVDQHVGFRRGDAASAPLGFDELTAFLEDYAPEQVSDRCGLSAAEIREAARWFGVADAALSFWTMGLNQQTHGVAANRMTMALHLLTGQIGRPGAGPFSLTGQPNAGGGVRDTGALAHALPAGRSVADPEHRAQMERLWGVPQGRISPEPGLSAVPLFEAMRDGRVQAALVMATNPARSLPNAERHRTAMEDCFLVVSDSIYPTDTAERADVFLPAAMWAEKEGVFSNSERRYHLVEKLVEPPGEARGDLEILVGLADRLGYGEVIGARTPEAIWNEWRQISSGSVYDFSGITYERLRTEPGILWPCPTEDHPGTCIRYVPGEDPLAEGNGRVDFYGRPDGRALVYLSEQGPFREPTDEEYPFVLTTGRRLEHWHTSTITGRVPELASIATDYLEIHPTDAEALGIESGEPVTITSRRGAVTLQALASERVRPGLVFALMHPLRALVNSTTIDELDPISGQPEYKLCAVRVEPLASISA